jgi:hypothetical protein
VTAQLVDAALAAAERGWPVFPLVPGRKAPRRSAAAWECRATVDRARIARWWAAHPRDNVGIATGSAGLVVVDLDVARADEEPPDQWPGAAGGADVLDALAVEHGERLPATFTVTTPSGGRHLYFERLAGPELRSTAGRLGWHIDTRAAGGYVVAAGSAVAGRRYAVCDESPPVPLPPWIGRLLAPPPTTGVARPARRPPAPPSRRRGYVAAALDGEVRRVLDAGPHTRNHALNKAAWNLGRYVAAGVLPRHVVEDALCAAGEAAGYRDGSRAVAAVVRNALDARIARHPTSSPATTEAHP